MKATTYTGSKNCKEDDRSAAFGRTVFIFLYQNAFTLGKKMIKYKQKEAELCLTEI